MSDRTPMSTTKIIRLLAAAILFFLGIIFAIAAFLFFAAGSVLVYSATREPKTIVQRLEVSGEMKAVGIKCPNCGAFVDAGRIEIVSGVLYAT